MFISNIVVDWVNNTLHGFLLLLDSVVFWFASQCYQLFIKLAGTRIFEDAFFSNFANRIYVILGIFMLFYLAYALLMAIIDPEKFAKGDKGVSKIASNLVVSLVILGFLPTIFSYAYRLQNYVLSSNLIGSLLTGSPIIDVNNSNGNNNQMVKYGDVLSFTVLNTFLNPENINFSINQNYTWYDFKIDVLENSNYTAMPGMNKAVSTGAVTLNSSGGTGSSEIISYMPVISTAVGVFLCYILLNFLLNLGGRVAKMAFYQLLAPIPVIMRVIPGKKGTFDKYLKQATSVFFEVFTYTGALYLGIYFIDAIANSSSLSQFFGAGSGVQGKLAFLVILMGILTFAKEMPKKLSEILGIETSGFKFGIKDKLKAGGFFAGGAMLGAGATGLVQNMTNGFKNVKGGLAGSADKFKKATTLKGKAGALFGGALGLGSNLLGTGVSMMAGTTSGAYNAYGTGKDAKNFKDMQKAASAGATKSLENREKRAAYRASHGGTIGAMIGHASDAIGTASTWSGLSAGIDTLKRSHDRLSGVSDSRKAVMDRIKFIRDTAEKGKRHVSFTYKDINDVTQTVNDQELGYLRQHYEHLKTTGASAEDLRNMQLLLDAAETQANKDIANGLDMDGTTPLATNKYDGELKANIIKLMTNIQNASSDLKDNVTINSADLDKALEFTQDNISKDIAEFAHNGGKVFEDLVGSVNKPTLEAKSVLQQQINKEIEKKESKK